MSKTSNEVKVHASLWLVNIIYASSFTITKIALPDHIPPSGFILLRILGSLLCMFLWHSLFVREKIRDKKDFLTLIACSFFGVACNMMCFFQGLSRTSPINAALIMVTTPILVLIIGYFTKNETINKFKLFGIVLGTLGAILLIVDKDATGKVASMLGDTFIFFNAASYAVFLVIVKKLMVKYSPVTIMMWCFNFGGLMVMPFGFQEVMDVKWSSFDGWVWFSVLFTIFVTTFVAYMLSAWALSHVKSSTVSAYIYVQPFLGTVIAVFLGKYPFHYAYLFYGLMIFLGVWLVSRKQLTKDINN